MKCIEFPNAKEIEKFVEEYNKQYPFFAKNYNAALLLFKAFPINDSYESIFIKVNFVNGAFSTAIRDVAGYSKQIFENVANKDKRLVKGDLTLIDAIADYRHVNKGRRNFSFASKYCHCHQPELFPINDKYVRKSLFELNQIEKFSDFTKQDLTKYENFINVMKDFKKKINGNELTNATIDRFLWAWGKAANSTY